jgi:TonB family protein
MSFTRAIVAFVVLTGTTSWLCASPLKQEIPNAAGPLERRATTVTPQNPVPRLTRVVMPPNSALGRPIVVALRVTLDEQGRVGEVRALGPGSEMYSFYVSRPTGAEVLAFGPITDQMPPRPDAYRVLENAAINALQQWQYEPPLKGPIVFNVVLGFEGLSEARLLSNGVTGDAGANSTAPRKEPLPPNADLGPDWTQGAVRVEKEIDRPLKLKDVAVEYPPIAQSARVQGVVTLDVRIERDGRVSNARVVAGPPLLRQVAIDGVVQWEFTPPVLNGRPAAVLMTVTVEFKLML